MDATDRATYDRYKQAIAGLRLPLAFVDLPAFDRNVSYVAATQAATGKTIRVGTKSIRSVNLIRRVLEKGGKAFKGLLCFTVEEAAFLAERGFDDIIVAYPSVQACSVDLLVELSHRDRLVSLVVDSVEQLAILAEAGRRSKTRLRLCLDVDMSWRPLGKGPHIGVRRSPLRSVEDCLALAREALRHEWLLVDSLMGYEAHIASTADDLPGKGSSNALMRLMKRLSSRELDARRGSIVAGLRGLGLSLRAVNGGGSGSLRYSGADPCLTEVTAGSAFFCPGLFQNFSDLRFEPSAFFALEVSRRPASGMVTCLGGGYPASGGPGPDRLPRPVLPPGLRYLPLEGAGEVQTPLLLPESCPELLPGDPVFFQHAKAGELGERFNDYLLVDGDRAVGKAGTYRGEGRAFL